MATRNGRPPRCRTTFNHQTVNQPESPSTRRRGRGAQGPQRPSVSLIHLVPCYVGYGKVKISGKLLFN